MVTRDFRVLNMNTLCMCEEGEREEKDCGGALLTSSLSSYFELSSSILLHMRVAYQKEKPVDGCWIDRKTSQSRAKEEEQTTKPMDSMMFEQSS